MTMRTCIAGKGAHGAPTLLSTDNYVVALAGMTR